MSPLSRKIRLILELRRQGVTDARVLGAMERVPRENFVPAQFRDQAYLDRTLPIGRHQTISAPSVVAQMTEALEVGDRMKVLEIGTGSGYQAAILAVICRRLYTIERHNPLMDEAEARFGELGLTNVTTRRGDGNLGWPEQAPFDRIIVTAAAPVIPQVLLAQLAIGGVMVVPVGEQGRDQSLVRLRRYENEARAEDLGPVRFVPMVEGIAESQ